MSWFGKNRGSGSVILGTKLAQVGDKNSLWRFQSINFQESSHPWIKIHQTHQFHYLALPQKKLTRSKLTCLSHKSHQKLVNKLVSKTLKFCSISLIHHPQKFVNKFSNFHEVCCLLVSIFTRYFSSNFFSPQTMKIIRQITISIKLLTRQTFSLSLSAFPSFKSAAILIFSATVRSSWRLSSCVMYDVNFLNSSANVITVTQID